MINKDIFFDENLSAFFCKNCGEKFFSTDDIVYANVKNIGEGLFHLECYNANK